MDADGLLRDRRDAFRVSGSITGVTLSACQARFVWQAWHFQYLHRCPRKLGDEGGPMDGDGLLRDRRDPFSISGSICVAGVALSVPA